LERDEADEEGEHMEEGKREGFQFCINFEGVFTDIDS
jgi:hypothetical protein